MITSDKEVRLRALEPEDLELLYHIENDRQLWDVGTTNVPYSRYVLHDYIANASGNIYNDGEVRLIIENGVGETVGIIDITDFDAKNQRAEVGIVVTCENRRKGIATAALCQIADYSLRVLHLHQLYAVVGENNEAALELFRKVGYTEHLQLRDWLYDGKNYHSAVLMQIFL
jgi:diamine N-acetyltransferase